MYARGFNQLSNNCGWDVETAAQLIDESARQAMNHDIHGIRARLDQCMRLLKGLIGMIADDDGPAAVVNIDAMLLPRAEVLGLQRRVWGFVEWPAGHDASFACLRSEATAHRGM